METYKIKKWKHIDDMWAFDDKFPRVTLADASCHAPLTCEIYKDNSVKLSTSGGGGHGEPNFRDKGRHMEEWLELFEEAQLVQGHYYPGVK